MMGTAQFVALSDAPTLWLNPESQSRDLDMAPQLAASWLSSL
jgi:hypothetical protein